MIEWIMLVPSAVFTRIKTDFSGELKTKYGMKGENFSTVDSNNSKAVFPFIYVHFLPATEVGADLEGREINAGTFTFQIDVYDNRSRNRAKEVMSEVVRIMKSMRFFINSMPEFSSVNGIHRCTMRARRVIGSGDIL